jgi:hypothetical protein
LADGGLNKVDTFRPLLDTIFHGQLTVGFVLSGRECQQSRFRWQLRQRKSRIHVAYYEIRSDTGFLEKSVTAIDRDLEFGATQFLVKREITLTVGAMNK